MRMFNWITTLGLFNFTGKYPKKQNKLSQKAKRKRARQRGGKK